MSMSQVTGSVVRKSQQGFVVLLAVLIIGAVSVSISLALLGGGADNQRAAMIVQQSAQARQLVDACAEEALQIIQSTTTFVGTSALTLGAGDCSYTVTSTGSSTRTVTASGTVGEVVRKLQLSVTIGSSISVTSWQDVP